MSDGWARVLRRLREAARGCDVRALRGALEEAAGERPASEEEAENLRLCALRAQEVLEEETRFEARFAAFAQRTGRPPPPFLEAQRLGRRGGRAPPATASADEGAQRERCLRSLREGARGCDVAALEAALRHASVLLAGGEAEDAELSGAVAEATRSLLEERSFASAYESRREAGRARQRERAAAAARERAAGSSTAGAARGSALDQMEDEPRQDAPPGQPCLAPADGPPVLPEADGAAAPTAEGAVAMELVLEVVEGHAQPSQLEQDISFDEAHAAETLALASVSTGAATEDVVMAAVEAIDFPADASGAEALDGAVARSAPGTAAEAALAPPLADVSFELGAVAGEPSVTTMVEVAAGDTEAVVGAEADVALTAAAEAAEVGAGDAELAVGAVDGGAATTAAEAGFAAPPEDVGLEVGAGAAEASIATVEDDTALAAVESLPATQPAEDVSLDACAGGAEASVGAAADDSVMMAEDGSLEGGAAHATALIGEALDDAIMEVAEDAVDVVAVPLELPLASAGAPAEDAAAASADDTLLAASTSSPPAPAQTHVEEDVAAASDNAAAIPAVESELLSASATAQAEEDVAAASTDAAVLALPAELPPASAAPAVEEDAPMAAGAVLAGAAAELLAASAPPEKAAEEAVASEYAVAAPPADLPVVSPSGHSPEEVLPQSAALAESWLPGEGSAAEPALEAAGAEGAQPRLPELHEREGGRATDEWVGDAANNMAVEAEAGQERPSLPPCVAPPEPPPPPRRTLEDLEADIQKLPAIDEWRRVILWLDMSRAAVGMDAASSRSRGRLDRRAADREEELDEALNGGAKDEQWLLLLRCYEVFHACRRGNSEVFCIATGILRATRRPGAMEVLLDRGAREGLYSLLDLRERFSTASVDPGEGFLALKKRLNEYVPFDRRDAIVRLGGQLGMPVPAVRGTWGFEHVRLCGIDVHGALFRRVRSRPRRRRPPAILSHARRRLLLHRSAQAPRTAPTGAAPALSERPQRAPAPKRAWPGTVAEGPPSPCKQRRADVSGVAEQQLPLWVKQHFYTSALCAQPAGFDVALTAQVLRTLHRWPGDLSDPRVVLWFPGAGAETVRVLKRRLQEYVAGDCGGPAGGARPEGVAGAGGRECACSCRPGGVWPGDPYVRQRGSVH